MSHEPSLKRRAGAAFTSLATAAALAVPLALPAAAAPGDGNPDVASLEVTAGDDEHNLADGTTTHTFTVQATDDAGDPVDEATVSAEIIDGPNADTDSATRDFACDTGTDASGDCDVPGPDDPDYTSTETGTDTVRFWVDLDGDDTFDEDEVEVQATKHWFGEPAAMTVAPEADTAAIETCNDYTVTITDAEGNAVVGQEVRISRDHAETDEATESVEDQLTFCEPTTDGNDVTTTEDNEGAPGADGDDEGATDAGTDETGELTFGISSELRGDETVRVYVDADANGDFDEGELTVEATKTWTFPGEVDRLFLEGGDRHDTAVAISRNAFPGDESLDNVVLARSTDYPDALAGTPLAVDLGAPMLLTPDPAATPPDWALHPKTEEEIDRLLTENTGDTVTILGGEAAVGADVELLLESKGYEVERVKGESRFETAIAIADQITGETAPESVFVTTGQNFPDALTAGAAAVEANGVIVLSDGDNQVEATTTYLQQHEEEATEYAVGGPAARAYDEFVEEDNELTGAGRYETAMVVVERFWPDGHPQVGVARADVLDGIEKFPDGLSGGTHIGHLGGPLLLTEPSRLLDTDDGDWDNLSPQEYLQSHAEIIDIAYLYGGTEAISEATADEVRDAIRGIE